MDDLMGNGSDHLGKEGRDAAESPEKGNEDGIRQSLRNAHLDTRRMAERYQLAVQGANDLLWDYSAADNTLFVSDRLYAQLGYASHEFHTLFQNPMDLLAESDRDVLVQCIRSHVADRTPRFFLICRLKTSVGGYRTYLLSGRVQTGTGGEVVRVAGSLTDQTDRRMMELEIRQLAQFDNLTSLPNRLALFGEMDMRMALGPWLRGIVVMDLDNFKWVNDAYDHSIGDSLLQVIGTRLSTLVKDSSEILLFRLSGDEFVFALGGKSTKNDVDRLARSISEMMEEPFLLERRSLRVTGSIGCALFPDDGTLFQELLRNADLAMGEAKRMGRNQICCYNVQMGQRVAWRRKIESAMMKALDNGEFRVYFQPIIRLDGERPSGFESLLRWFSPELGNIRPDEFIPVAEESGLIIPLGAWVMEEACRFAVEVRKRYGAFFVTVNTCAMQWMRPEFEEMVLHAADKAGLEHSALGIELTESMLVLSPKFFEERMIRLREQGFHLLLDDFGTGYSSLSYLLHLPFHTVKIDHSFVKNFDHESRERRLMGSILELAGGIGMDVVVEGIETMAQRKYLEDKGCPMIQGNQAGHPMPAGEAMDWIRDRV